MSRCRDNSDNYGYKYTEKLDVKNAVQVSGLVPHFYIRKCFLEIHAAITEGYPNHRIAFQQVAPQKLSDEYRRKMYPALMSACRANGLCARCEGKRNPRNEQQQQHCSSYNKKCSPKITPECLSNTCIHTRHETQMIWRNDMSI